MKRDGKINNITMFHIYGCNVVYSGNLTTIYVCSGVCGCVFVCMCLCVCVCVCVCVCSYIPTPIYTCTDAGLIVCYTSDNQHNGFYFSPLFALQDGVRNQIKKPSLTQI